MIAVPPSTLSAPSSVPLFATSSLTSRLYSKRLGHFGLLFAKALGANVTAISHSESKKADAEKMGATRFIATHEGKPENFKPYKRSLDLIVVTSNA